MNELEYRYQKRRPTLMAANALYLLAAAGTITAGFVIGTILYAFQFSFTEASYEIFNTVLNTTIEIALFLLPATLYAVNHRGVSLSMRLTSPSVRHMLFAVISAPVAAIFINGVSVLWTGLIELTGGVIPPSSLPIPTDRRGLLLSTLSIGIMPGICEEVLFRGAILGAWERRGTRYAIVVSALLFCALHGSVAGLPAQLGMGLLLGYIVVITDSLYVGMLYHSMYNITLVVLSYIAAVGQPEPAAETALSALEIMPEILLPTLFYGALFMFTLRLITHGNRARSASIEKVRVPNREKMPWMELLVLIVGIITVMYGYINDLAEIYRWFGL